LKVNAPLIIEQRRNNLLGRFPDAIFTDLTDKSYYGWRAERALLREKFRQTPEYNPETDLLLKQAAYRLNLDADEFKRADDYYHFVNDIRRQRERKKYLKRVFRGWQNSDERCVPQTT
jgi:hypothetical protein